MCGKALQHHLLAVAVLARRRWRFLQGRWFSRGEAVALEVSPCSRWASPGIFGGRRIRAHAESTCRDASPAQCRTLSISTRPPSAGIEQHRLDGDDLVKDSCIICFFKLDRRLLRLRVNSGLVVFVGFSIGPLLRLQPCTSRAKPCVMLPVCPGDRHQKFLQCSRKVGRPRSKIGIMRREGKYNKTVFSISTTWVAADYHMSRFATCRLLYP